MEAKQFGHYQVVSELGRGGMGVVYKAHEMSLNRHVAIKVLAKHLAGEEQLVSRFIREAKSAASLNHPNVIQIYFIGEQDNEHYFVMEYVEGRSLSQQIRAEGRIGLDRAVQIVIETASALEAAHKQGIIHRDIKPANIMISPAGLVKVTDFGIAFMPDPSEKLTATGQFMGTPGYLPPEPYHGLLMDQRSDIYSLGIVFFEMLTGEVPFKATSPVAMMREVIEGVVPPVTGRISGVDDTIQQILNRMTAKDPEARYSDCSQIIADLHAWRGTVQPVSAPFTPPPPPIPGAPTDEAAPTHTSLYSNPPLLDESSPPPLPVVPETPAPASEAVVSAPEPPVRAPTPPVPAGKGKKPSKLILMVVVLLTFGLTAFFLTRNESVTPNPSAGLTQPGLDTAQNTPDDSGRSGSNTTPSNSDALDQAGVHASPAPLDSPQSAATDPAGNSNEPRRAAPDDVANTAHNLQGEPVGAVRMPQAAKTTPVTSQRGAAQKQARAQDKAGDGGVAQALSAPGSEISPAAAPAQGVAVLVSGDPGIEDGLFDILQTYLENDGFELSDLDLDPSRLGNRTPAAARARRAVPLDSGVGWLILCQVVPTGSREVAVRGGSTIYQARIKFTLYNLNQPKKFRTHLVPNVEYTHIKAQTKAQQAVLKIYDELVAPMRR